MNDRYAAPDYWQWFLDVAGWDGLFPLLIFQTSFWAAKWFPNNQGLAEVLMVCLPILGVLTRFTMGSKKINANACKIWLRRLQFVALGCAALLFMAFDFFVVWGAFLRRQNKNLFGPTDWWAIGMMASFYLVLVVFAMYPGRRFMFDSH